MAIYLVFTGEKNTENLWKGLQMIWPRRRKYHWKQIMSWEILIFKNIQSSVMKATVFENRTPMSWHLLVHKQTQGQHLAWIHKAFSVFDLAKCDSIHAFYLWDGNLWSQWILHWLLLLHAIPSYIMLDSLKQKRCWSRLKAISFRCSYIFSLNPNDNSR